VRSANESRRSGDDDDDDDDDNSDGEEDDEDEQEDDGDQGDDGAADDDDDDFEGSEGSIDWETLDFLNQLTPEQLEALPEDVRESVQMMWAKVWIALSLAHTCFTRYCQSPLATL
jgi:hypothetical protein